jgi:UDP-N-acetylmuramoylalanine--D-glutamate ligase
MKIGIWGFGVVGKSALSFLSSTRKGSSISIFDAKEPSEQDQELARAHGATFFKGQPEDFLKSCDHILVSPGIDLRPYSAYASKCWCELDLFVKAFVKPVIAVTGTLGKTTTTNLLTYFMNLLLSRTGEEQYEPFVAGGNVGYGMLDLALNNAHVGGAVLELSSFQLENAHSFAPDCAIWTNLHPNHLDRHSTMQEYAAAKVRIALPQSEGQALVLPVEFVLDEQYSYLREIILSCKARKYFVAPYEISVQQLRELAAYGARFVVNVRGDTIHLRGVARGGSLCSIPFKNLLSITFLENWLCIIAALHAMGKDCFGLEHHATDAQLKALCKDFGQHRVEHVATVRGIDFYNDSKSTVVEATLKALEHLARNNRPIIVMLGGKSKGVDQSALWHTLTAHNAVKHVVCFGLECSRFPQCPAYATLPEALDAVLAVAQKGDQVLFSPAGASFDLFKDYKHRGDVFKALVRSFS